MSASSAASRTSRADGGRFLRRPIAARGDLPAVLGQHLADRLNPTEAVLVLVDEPHERGVGRSSSAAKKADAARLSHESVGSRRRFLRWRRLGDRKDRWVAYNFVAGDRDQLMLLPAVTTVMVERAHGPPSRGMASPVCRAHREASSRTDVLPSPKVGRPANIACHPSGVDSLQASWMAAV
jgi:hypothetical protein